MSLFQPIADHTRSITLPLCVELYVCCWMVYIQLCCGIVRVLLDGLHPALLWNCTCVAGWSTSSFVVELYVCCWMVYIQLCCGIVRVLLDGLHPALLWNCTCVAGWSTSSFVVELYVCCWMVYIQLCFYLSLRGFFPVTFHKDARECLSCNMLP